MRSLAIRSVSLRLPEQVEGRVRIEIDFNPASDALLGIVPDPGGPSEPLREVFAEELDLLDRAARLGLFGRGPKPGSITVLDGPAAEAERVLELDLQGVSRAVVAAFVLMVDLTSRARLALADEIEGDPRDLEQIASLVVDAGGPSVEPRTLLADLVVPAGRWGEAVAPDSRFFIENEATDLDTFGRAESEGARVDLEIDWEPDEAAFEEAGTLYRAWENLILKSAFAVSASGETWSLKERDIYGGGELTRSHRRSLFAFYESYDGPAGASFWLLDGLTRRRGMPSRVLANLVSPDLFDPDLDLDGVPTGS